MPYPPTPQQKKNSGCIAVLKGACIIGIYKRKNFFVGILHLFHDYELFDFNTTELRTNNYP